MQISHNTPIADLEAAFDAVAVAVVALTKVDASPVDDTVVVLLRERRAMLADALDRAYATVEDAIATVSAGTVLPSDLIPAFTDALARRDPTRADELRDAYLAVYALGDGPWDLDRDMWAQVSMLMKDLFDALNEVAGEGRYFGSAEGNRALYGFWASEWDAD